MLAALALNPVRLRMLPCCFELLIWAQEEHKNTGLFTVAFLCGGIGLTLTCTASSVRVDGVRSPGSNALLSLFIQAR